MELPRFSLMLVRRRRELGVTIEQAARALRLKERVIEAFEAGEWQSMPKSGYAQGMLASYARYLGLDSREVADVFAEDLELWQRSQGSDDLRLRGPDSTNVQSPSGGRRGYSGARGLLPTSGGYAGDMEGFASVSEVSSHGYARTRSSYGADPRGADGLGAEGLGADGANSDGRGVQGGSLGTARRYTARRPQGAGASREARTRTRFGSVRVEGYRDEEAREPRQTRQRTTYRPRVPVADEPTGRRDSGARRTRDVTTRRVRRDEYVDDLRYDDRAESYEAATTQRGRVGYRTLASPKRPNVRRRPSSTSSVRRPRRQGLIPSLLEGGGGIGVIVVVAALLLTVIIIFSVRSCVNNATTTEREAATVTTVEEGSAGSAEATQDGTQDGTQDEAASGEDATGQASAAATTTPTEPETKVEATVAVADAGITWVEITVDGEIVFAETVTGPWSGTYNVTRSMKVDVSEPSVVTVTRNGVPQTFDSKSSGVGTLTIDGPADLPTETTETTGQEGSQTQADGTVVGSNGSYTPIQYNDDGSWYDENWYYHDGNGGYYTDDGAYHEE